MKRVLVVGASGAIGQTVTRYLTGHARGFRVTGTYFQHFPLDGQDALQCDLTDPNMVEHVIDTADPDILINCAGVKHDTYRPEHIRQMLDVNLSAPIHMTRHASRRMKDQEYGRIIHLTSLAAHYPTPGASVYSATKAGLVGFVRSAAAELHPHKITVNAISPGLIDVGMGAHLPDKARQSLLQRIPSGEPGAAIQVAKTVEFLIGASYVTGQTIRVDGGMW